MKISTKKKLVQIQAKSQLADSVPFCKDNEFIICNLKQQKVESKIGFTMAIKNYDFPKPNIQYEYKEGQLTLRTNAPAFHIYLHVVKAPRSWGVAVGLLFSQQHTKKTIVSF